MRILILSFYYEPDLCAGSFRTTALVKELQSKLPSNVIIDVITTKPNRYKSFDVNEQINDYEKKDNVNVWRISLPSHKSGMLDQSKAFYHYFQKARKITSEYDYNLVFATSSRLFTGFLGASIARKKRAPLYLDIRDIFVDTLSDVLSKKASLIILPFIKLIENYTFSRADVINLVSQGFEDYFKKRFDKKYYFFSNGIDDEFIRPLTNKYEPRQVKTVLYAGNIGEGQGLHKIIPKLALSTSDKFRFKIIGDGGRLNTLEQNLRDLNITNVQLLPPVTRDSLVSHYDEADVLFLHLNDYDAFEKVLPSKIFEYAASGKPILAGVSGYAGKFVKDNVNNAEVFYPCDSDGAIRALQQLDYQVEPRTSFVEQFKRQVIMSKMAQTIVDRCREVK